MDKIVLDISNLQKCIQFLKTCTLDYKNSIDKNVKEYIEDACVKRFEYTVETSWKFMKKYLKLVYGKSEQELTMNTIFRLMEAYGFITSWENWRNYYLKRNDISHEYNQEKAKKILQITDNLVYDTEFLYQKLTKALEEEKINYVY